MRKEIKSKKALSFGEPVISLHHIGEHLVARLLAKALELSVDVPCQVREKSPSQKWKRDELFKSIGARKTSHLVCDSRLWHSSEKLNPIHRLDCGILRGTRGCFPLEVKLGVSWSNTGFRKKFIEKKPVKRNLLTDTWGGSVPSLLESHFKSEKLDASKLFVWIDQQKMKLDKHWGLVVRESQIAALKSEPFLNLTHLVSLEALIEVCSASFEEIAKPLVWKSGEAYKTLLF